MTRWERMTPAQRELSRLRNLRYKDKFRETIKARKRADYIKNKQKYLTLERDRQYRKRYGITLADYERMLQKQGGKCAICAATSGGRKQQAFAVDHDHSTGAVRGLLCIKCNARIGWLEWYDIHRRSIDRYLSSVAIGVA